MRPGASGTESARGATLGPPPERSLSAVSSTPTDAPLVRRLLPTQEQRFWALTVATGAASGLGAVALIHLLRAVTDLAWAAHGAEHFLGAAEAASPWRRLAVPALGGLVVVWVSLLVRQPLRGHGTAGIIEAIWARSGRLALPRALLRGVASIVAVGMGAPLGREGALLQTGAATGSALARLTRLSPDQTRLLVACGAASGIAAAYNVPIGGALFGLEVLLGSFALEMFGPIVLACVVSTLLSRALIADHPSYVIPAYVLQRPRELLLALPLGVLLGGASALYVRCVEGLADLADRVPRAWAAFLPIPAMAAVGAAAALGVPQLMGNGYDVVNAALLGRVPLLLLLVLPFAKLLATAGCAGAGVPGGLFTPSLFFGALLGGAFGVGAHALWPGVAPPGAFALLGMVGVLAGTTHASVSSVLLIFEMTGNYDVILPLMLCAVVATFVSRRLEPESLYTSVLRRRRVEVPRGLSPNWLEAASVQDVVVPDAQAVRAALPFPQVVELLLSSPPGSDVYVVDGERRPLGVVSLGALRGRLGDPVALSHLVAADVMDARVTPVGLGHSLSEAALRFADTPHERLPVVDDQGRLVGTLSKREVLRHGRF